MIETTGQVITLFFIYSFLGWVCECIYCSIAQRKIINRGFLAGPYCPIYGFGAVFVLVLLQPFMDNPLIVFLLGVLITSTLEYITSVVMEKIFHTRWWDYSHYKYNINGRVCLLNSFLFGVMSLFVVYIVHPPILHAVQRISPFILWCLDVLLVIYFSVDLFKTVHALLSRNKEFVEMEECLQELHEVMKGMTQYSEEIPFYERVQKMLDSTDADEHFSELVERMVDKVELMPQRSFRIRERLKKAFPNHTNNDFSDELRDWIDKTHEKHMQRLREARQRLKK